MGCGAGGRRFREANDNNGRIIGRAIIAWWRPFLFSYGLGVFSHLWIHAKNKASTGGYSEEMATKTALPVTRLPSLHSCRGRHECDLLLEG